MGNRVAHYCYLESIHDQLVRDGRAEWRRQGKSADEGTIGGGVTMLCVPRDLPSGDEFLVETSADADYMGRAART